MSKKQESEIEEEAKERRRKNRKMWENRVVAGILLWFLILVIYDSFFQ